ncbi:MAG: hypothetical protein K6C34_01610 [Alphaproteobacteria bacterium]|nr:hypothetical protein [Alphaproteobacteria bacterium]
MNRKIYMCLTVLIIIVLSVEAAHCGISHENIKEASRTFVSVMKDWMPVIVGAGLFGSGICLFASNFKMGIAGLAGTGFLYAAQSFVGTGEAALIQMAQEILTAVC